MEKSSSSGVDLQIGNEVEISAKVGAEAGGEGGKVSGEVSASTTIPPALTRAWSDSEESSNLNTFFSDENGMLIVASGECLLYNMKLSTYHLPPFSEGFKNALCDLYNSRDADNSEKIGKFRKFIKAYGTHYINKATLGTEYMYRSKFSKKAREQMSDSKLKTCSRLVGTKIFGIQVEGNKAGCSADDEKTVEKLNTEGSETKIVTKGARAVSDIKEWAKAKFYPVVLKTGLSPLVNLFTKNIISKANLKCNAQASGISKWFVPLYLNYCKSMGITCDDQKSGCGFDDQCPPDTFCSGSGGRHYCGGLHFIITFC